MKKVKEVLAKDVVQRVAYGLGLLLWTGMLWSMLSNEYSYSTSSLGISYFTLYIIPAFLLLLQTIRNNKVFWGLICGLFTTYCMFAFYMVAVDLIERSGDHVKAINLDFGSLVLLLITFILFGFISWVIYLMRPKRWV